MKTVTTEQFNATRKRMCELDVFHNCHICHKPVNLDCPDDYVKVTVLKRWWGEERPIHKACWDKNMKESKFYGEDCNHHNQFLVKEEENE